MLMSESMRLAFIMCTEGGQLEQESLLMVESFRRFAGNLKDSPIYSFQVRDKNDVSTPTLKALESFGVKHQKIVLNDKYPDYPLANKPLLCAYAEQNINAEIIVFLDSDLVFFSEPKEFLLPLEYDVGIRPEHEKMIGSEGKDDPNDEYWQHLYQLANVRDKDVLVTTTVDRKKIRAFWNSGVVAVRRNTGIFTAWQETFEKLLAAGSMIDSKNFYYEQSALSATICAKTKKIWQFSSNYNYPIHSHNPIIESQRVKSFKHIVCIHDHLFRSRKEWYRERTWVKTLKRLQNFDKKSPEYRWLYQYLQEHNDPPNFMQSLLEFVLFLPGIQWLLPYHR
jgi:hypothetical protein